MKKIGESARRYSADDLDRLVSSIVSGTEMSEQDLSKKMKYNAGYITQSRSRYNKSGIPIPPRLMMQLEELKKKTVNSNVPVTVDLDELRSMKAAIKSLSNFVAILASKSQGRPASDILEELEQSSHVAYRELMKG